MILNSNNSPENLLLLINQPEVGASGGASGGQRGSCCWGGGGSILHICHNHHNRWLCKKNLSSVKFSNGYVKETVLLLHKMCSFTKHV